jgi:hypothetical protein
MKHNTKKLGAELNLKEIKLRKLEQRKGVL